MAFLLSEDLLIHIATRRNTISIANILKENKFVQVFCGGSRVGISKDIVPGRMGTKRPPHIRKGGKVKNKEAVARLESIKDQLFQKPEYRETGKWLDIVALNKGITALENQSDELAAARLEERKRMHIEAMRTANLEIFLLIVLIVAVVVFAFIL